MSSNSTDKELLSIREYNIAIILLSQTTLVIQWHSLNPSLHTDIIVFLETDKTKQSVVGGGDTLGVTLVAFFDRGVAARPDHCLL